VSLQADLVWNGGKRGESGDRGSYSHYQRTWRAAKVGPLADARKTKGIDAMLKSSAKAKRGVEKREEGAGRLQFGKKKAKKRASIGRGDRIVSNRPRGAGHLLRIAGIRWIQGCTTSGCRGWEERGRFVISNLREKVSVSFVGEGHEEGRGPGREGNNQKEKRPKNAAR